VPSDVIDTLFAAEEPLRRDLLLEYLHRLHDEYNTLRPAHLRALADRLRLAETEVFEVASFYHHFELADDDTTPVPGLTVRVCDSLACAMAGAEGLAERLGDTLGREVNLQRVPCVGQCDGAPVAVVGTRVIRTADAATVRERIAGNKITPRKLVDAIDYATYRAGGGLYETRRDRRRAPADRRCARPPRGERLAWPGRRRLPDRAQVAHRP
jgi:formate dehydrogenase